MQPEEQARDIYQRECIECKEHFVTRDAQAEFCGQCKVILRKMAGVDAAAIIDLRLRGVIK